MVFLFLKFGYLINLKENILNSRAQRCAKHGCQFKISVGDRI